MDIPTLVTETVKCLAPALPLLHEGAREAVKSVGEAAGKVIAAHPEDDDPEAVQHIQLRKLLEAEPQFVSELAGMVKRIAVRSNEVNVIGPGAVGIGSNASGVAITTNVKK